MADDDPVLDLAAAVADGALDWERGAASLSDADRLAAEGLRLLARVAYAHKPEDFGHFERLVPLGAGSFGLVYRAWDTRLQREVALKFLTAEASLSEARLLAQVRHPNVVAVHAVETRGERSAIVMELLHGRTLAEALDDDGPLPLREATRIGIDLCRALGAVHGSGLVHGDVSARNVMLEPDGRVVLTDFGLGRWNADRSRAAPRGTRAYVAPELLAGRPPSMASDIFALGVLLDQIGRPVPRATAERPEDRPRATREIEHALKPPDRRAAWMLGLVAIAMVALASLWRDPAPSVHPPQGRNTPPESALTNPPPSTTMPRAERSPGVDPFVKPLATEGLPPGVGRPGYEGVFTVVARSLAGAIEIRASVPLSLYAIVESERGTRLAFPLPDAPLQNPLDAGVVHRIPMPARERIVLLASPRRLVDFEDRVRALRIPRAWPVTEVPLPDELVTMLRDGAGLPAEGRVWGMAAAVSGTVDLVRGGWVRRVEPRP